MAMMVCKLPECRRRRNVQQGIPHDFCGRTHAREAAERGLIPPLRRPHGVCHLCQLQGCNREVFFDEKNNRVHDFCCLTHANEAMARREWPRFEMQGCSRCQLPGCNQAVFRNPDTGEESAFCSRSHLSQAMQLQPAQPAAERTIACQHPYCSRPAWVDHTSGDRLAFCSSRCARDSPARLVGTLKCSLPGCNEWTMLHYRTRDDLGYCCDSHRMKAEQRSLTQNSEPNLDRTFRGGASDDFKLSVLTSQHEAYTSLKDQFLQKFVKPIDGLNVERILKVQVPEEVSKRHKAYEGKGNSRRRFHGTSCSEACRFFVDLRGGPCGRPDCNVCSICTHGFKLEGSVGQTAQRTNMNLRYGEGIYFSSVSGKANDYAQYSEKEGPRGK